LELRRLRWQVERIGGEAVSDVVEAEVVERVIPVDASKERVSLEPVPVRPRVGGQWVEIRAADGRRSARMWRKRDLWEFVLRAFETGEWSREYWQKRGVGQKEWADLKIFFERFNLWRIQDASTLIGWLAATGYAVTNERELSVTNGGDDGEAL